MAIQPDGQRCQACGGAAVVLPTLSSPIAGEAEAPAPQSWQPIETAPCGQRVALLKADGAILHGDWGDYYLFNVPKITHWMPMPEKPGEAPAPLSWKVYELILEQELVDGAGLSVNDRRYFAAKDAAIAEGQRCANVYAAMIERPLPRHDVNRFGIVVAWEEEQCLARVVVHEGTLELQGGEAPAPRPIAPLDQFAPDGCWWCRVLPGEAHLATCDRAMRAVPVTLKSPEVLAGQIVDLRAQVVALTADLLTSQAEADRCADGWEREVAQSAALTTCAVCDLRWSGPWTDCPGCQAIAGMQALAGDAIPNAVAVELAGQANDLQAQIVALRAELEERRKDNDFHRDCRPNRRQAEAALKDAKELADWRADVTAALRRPGGAFYTDVPQHIRDLVDAREAAEARVRALQAALVPSAVDTYCRLLPWSSHATDDERTLVDGNLRSFAATLRALLPSPLLPQSGDPFTAVRVEPTYPAPPEVKEPTT